MEVAKVQASELSAFASLVVMSGQLRSAAIFAWDLDSRGSNVIVQIRCRSLMIPGNCYTSSKIPHPAFPPIMIHV